MERERVGGERDAEKQGGGTDQRGNREGKEKKQGVRVCVEEKLMVKGKCSRRRMMGDGAKEGRNRQGIGCTENVMWRTSLWRGLISRWSWDGNLEISAWNVPLGRTLIYGGPHGEMGWIEKT